MGRRLGSGATLASRYVRWTGYVVLAFIVYHLAQFTFGVTNPADFKAGHDYVMQHDYSVMKSTAAQGRHRGAECLSDDLSGI